MKERSRERKGERDKIGTDRERRDERRRERRK